MRLLSDVQVFYLQAAHTNDCLGFKFAVGHPRANTLRVLVELGLMTKDKHLTDKGRAQIRKGIGLERYVEDDEVA